MNTKALDLKWKDVVHSRCVGKRLLPAGERKKKHSKRTSSFAFRFLYIVYKPFHINHGVIVVLELDFEAVKIFPSLF